MSLLTEFAAPLTFSISARSTILFWCQARRLDTWTSGSVGRSDPRPDRLPPRQTMLLILDSCEHVIETAGGAAERIFERHRRCTFWRPAGNRCVSKANMFIGCCRWAARPMMPVSPRRRPLGFPAVQLFVERAIASVAALIERCRCTRRR